METTSLEFARALVIEAAKKAAQRRPMPSSSDAHDATNVKPDLEPLFHNPQVPSNGWAKIIDLPVEVVTIICTDITWTDFMSLRAICRKMKWLLDEQFVSRAALRVSFDERGLSDFRKFAEDENMAKKLTTLKFGNRMLSYDYALTTHFTSLFGIDEVSRGSLTETATVPVNDAALQAELAPSSSILKTFVELMSMFSNVTTVDTFQEVFEAQFSRTDYDGLPVFDTVTAVAGPLEAEDIYRGRSAKPFSYRDYHKPQASRSDPTWTSAYMLLDVVQLRNVFPKLDKLRLSIPVWSEPSGFKLADLALPVSSIAPLQELTITMEDYHLSKASVKFFDGLASSAEKGMLEHLQVLKIQPLCTMPSLMNAVIRLLRALSSSLKSVSINMIIIPTRDCPMRKFLATVVTLPSLDNLEVTYEDDGGDAPTLLWSAQTHAGIVEEVGPYLIHYGHWWQAEWEPRWDPQILEVPVEREKVLQMAKKVLGRSK